MGRQFYKRSSQMKKKIVFVLGIAVFLLLVTGCATSIKEGYSGTTWNIGVPAAKNIEIIGLVHYEGYVDRGLGEKMTYDALLKEAERLGGNGIVNIMIDVKTEGIRFFNWLFDRKETWYGSALAIKYLNENLSEVTETVDENGETTTRTNTPRSINESGLSSNRSLLELRLLYLEEQLGALKKTQR
jgi:hypothetical protein